MNSRRSEASPPPEAVPEPCPLSEAEKEEVRAFENRRRNRPRPPRVKTQPGRRGMPLTLEPASLLDNVRLRAAFGTADPGFADLMLSELLNAACEGGPSNPPSAESINQALAAVTGIGPRDETEAMLATQMVATHFVAMTLLRRLKSVETLQQQDSTGNLATKLLRTYAMQVEALQRYRGKGQQKVTVEHVHVHSGGQAIVGTVQGGSQALSRSLFARMIPKHKSSEYFGFFAVFEKFAGIAGPALFAASVMLFHSSRAAVLSVLLFFVLGAIVLTRVDVAEGEAQAQSEEAATGFDRT